MPEILHSVLDDNALDCHSEHEGRIFVGFDCDDSGLGFAVHKGGREPFLFASDFPHEIFDAETCRHELNELLAREDLSKEDKEAVVGGNAERLYRLPL